MSEEYLQVSELQQEENHLTTQRSTTVPTTRTPMPYRDWTNEAICSGQGRGTHGETRANPPGRLGLYTI